MRRVVVWLVVLLLGLVAAAQPAQAETAGQSSVAVDGKSVAFDVEPTVVNWVLMVPIRAVAESLGGEVTWQAEQRTAVIQSGTTRLELKVDSDVAVVNGQAVKLAAPVIIRENRTLVPASFLLTLFGQKLTIDSPGLKDPVAMALLEKSQTTGVRNVDLQMVQQTVMSTKHGSVQQEMPMTISMEARIRGDDIFLASTMQMQQEKVGTSSVIRNGKAYSRLEGQPWTELPANQAAVMLSQELDGLQMLIPMVKEAHMGATRTVNGKTQQDVVITFDVAALKRMTDQLIASAPPDPGVQINMVWENATATLTLDAGTGRTIRGVVDTAVSTSVTFAGEAMSMRMVMHQEITQQPNDQPIAWPADLPK